jgi:hypothetical protein
MEELMKWDNVLFDQTSLAELRERHRSPRERLEKTAGIFMRPSDIGGHRELASGLEELLNGQPSEVTFKDQPGDVSKTAGATDLAIGAALGGTAGYYALRRSQASPIPPPSQPEGALSRAKRKTHEYVQANPKTSLAAGVIAGAGGGALALHGSDLIKRLKDLRRK